MTISDIEQLEERLRRAMLAGDIAELDALISDRLLFVTPDGRNIDKAGDLEAHRSGLIRILTLEPLERHVDQFGDIAVVNVEMKMVGDYAGTAFTGRFRYTRVWFCCSSQAQVVAGHVCAIQ